MCYNDIGLFTQNIDTVLSSLYWLCLFETIEYLFQCQNHYKVTWDPLKRVLQVFLGAPDETMTHLYPWLTNPILGALIFQCITLVPLSVLAKYIKGFASLKAASHACLTLIVVQTSSSVGDRVHIHDTSVNWNLKTFNGGPGGGA